MYVCIRAHVCVLRHACTCACIHDLCFLSTEHSLLFFLKGIRFKSCEGNTKGTGCASAESQRLHSTSFNVWNDFTIAGRTEIDQENPSPANQVCGPPFEVFIQVSLVRQNTETKVHLALMGGGGGARYWCSKFNGNHFGLPPSSTHRITGQGGNCV